MLNSLFLGMLVSLFGNTIANIQSGQSVAKKQFSKNESFNRKKLCHQEVVVTNNLPGNVTLTSVSTSIYTGDYGGVQSDPWVFTNILPRQTVNLYKQINSAFCNCEYITTSISVEANKSWSGYVNIFDLNGNYLESTFASRPDGKRMEWVFFNRERKYSIGYIVFSDRIDSRQPSQP